MPLKINQWFKLVHKIFQILVLAALTFWAVHRSVVYFQFSQAVWNQKGLNQDAATEWEKRLSALREDLPERGVIGYVSEQDYPGVSFNIVDQDEEFALTQYALAPLILDRGNPHHELVIGNFSTEYEYQFEKELGLRLLMGYGMGIFLFQGEPQP